MDSTSKSSKKPSDYTDKLAEENLRLLLDTIEGIQQANEFKSVLAESMEATRLVMNSEASSLILMDDDRGELFISVPTGPAKKEVIGKTIPKGKGIAGWVAEKRTPYLSNDVSNSKHFYGDLSKDFTTRSMMCIPLINRSNEVIGVLQAINKRKDAEFSPHEIPVFQALGSHITAAIERTRHIDRLHDSLKKKDAAITHLHQRITKSFHSILDLIKEEKEASVKNNNGESLERIESSIAAMSSEYNDQLEKNLANGIELGFYLEQISDRINEVLRSFGLKINLHPDSVQTEVKQEQALLCGLIVNELLINVYRHALPAEGDELEPSVLIRISHDDQEVKLTVSDSGIILPESLDLNKKQSIGLWLVDDLLNKLNATIQAKNRADSRFVISF